MAERIKRLYLYDEEDEYNRCSQEIIDPDHEVSGYFVQDLWDCPEDATVSRDLVSAHQWLRFVNEGIQLAKMGYDRAVLVEREREE